MQNKSEKVQQEINLIELFEQFGSEDKCRLYLETLRFPNGIICTRCQSDKISRIKKRNQFACDACKYQFSALAGTIFHDTHLPLFKWFAAVYLMLESKKGISANQLSRTLKMSYKTAWFLSHRIRESLKTESETFGGTVEIDETYIGGKLANKHGEALEHARNKPLYGKIIAAGALERGGKVQLKRIAGPTKEILTNFAKSVTQKFKTERVFTDDLPSYKFLEDEIRIDHETVCHSEGQYVRHNVIHTNGIENVFSLLKRSIIGSFHHVSEKHLDKYLDEFEFRFNNRENPYLFRDCILRLLNAENIEYKDLVKK